jgi:cholest-4-en-3-one 26-monooxygenase
MSVDSVIGTRPDIDLADGEFYAGDSRAAYRWMRANEPVFRDRNGLAGIASYKALIEAERTFGDASWSMPDFPESECRISARRSSTYVTR